MNNIEIRVMAFCVALSLAVLPAWSSVYYIDSQNGSDAGDGTTTNTAWQTLGKVNATLLAAGDSVLFKRGGAWTGSLTIANSGTSNNPITYAAYGSGNQPAIRVTNVMSVIRVTGDWIVLDGLHIIGNGGPSGNATWAVDIPGSHVTVTNCEINSAGAGVYTTGHFILVTHCNIHDMVPCHDDPGGDDDYGGNGVIMNTGASDIEVAYCRLVNLIGHSYDYGSDGGAVELWGAVARVKVHHNYVNNCCGFLESGGLYGEPVTDVAAYYNVIVNITGSPLITLHVGDGKFGIVPSNFRFHNNTCINGGWSYGMGSYIACSNNILVSSSLGGNQGNNYSGNPGFVNLAAGDYHLSSNATACIDQGVNLGYTPDFDGVAVPQGAAPDIGAFEFIPNTYTITYNGNVNDSGTVPADQTKTENQPLTLATNSGNLARTGFTFAGWNTAADGSGTSYSPGGTYLANSALALYGKWVVLTPVYWDNNGGTTNSWDSVANWSTVVGGGSTPTALPGGADVATFSATPVQGANQTINLNSSPSVLGLNVLPGVTTTTTLQGGGTNRVLTIGASGITNAGSGAVLIGSGTAGQNVNIVLTGSQSIANNGTGKVTIFNAVTGSGSPTLTNNGSGTGVVWLAGTIGNTVTKIVQDSTTSLLALRHSQNAFGNLEIKKGTVETGNGGTALGAGAVTLGGAADPASLFHNDNGNASYPNSFNLATGAGTPTIGIRGDGAGTYTATFTGGVTGTNSLTIDNNGGDEKLTFSTGALNHAGTITHIGTGTGDSTINSVIGTNVTGVTQNSATSRLVLTGTNTYTGDTTVSAGILAVDGDAIPNTGKLVINGGKVDPSGATETVGTLFFGAAQQIAGMWGSTTSTATNQNDTYFTGTGVVSVTNGPSGGFAAWAASQSPPVTGGPNGDDDNDGVENLVEYALADGQERGSLSGSTLTFTKRGAPWGGDVAYSIETSEDLGISDPWQAATPDVNDASTISYTLPNPGDNFARLKVRQVSQN